MEVDTEELVEAYIAIRDRKEALYREYQDNVKKLDNDLRWSVTPFLKVVTPPTPIVSVPSLARWLSPLNLTTGLTIGNPSTNSCRNTMLLTC